MKAFKYPIRPVGGLKPVITQRFGVDFKLNGQWVYRRFGMKGHNGIDFRTRYATSPLGRIYVYNPSPFGGTIVNGQDNGYGVHVRIRHDDGSETIFAHLTTTYLPNGSRVKGYDDRPIGLTGNTGFSTAPHLHFGYRPPNMDIHNGYNGWIDPAPFFEERSIPVSPLSDKDIKLDEYIFSMSIESEGKTWDIPYREQGGFNNCTTMAITNAILGLTGQQFSPLAFHADIESDPQKGIHIRNAMRHMESVGLVLESHIPYGDPWRETPQEKMARANKVLKNKQMKRHQFSYIRLDRFNQSEIDTAVLHISPVVVRVPNSQTALTGKPYRESDSKAGYHAVTLIDKIDNDTYRAIDTLRFTGDDDGIRVVHFSQIQEAWAVVDKFNTKEIRVGWTERYGKEENRRKELQANAHIYEGIMRTRREDLMEEYMRNQQMYINAVAYGGYNAHYFKLGKWFAGDVINYMHAKINNRTLPFDLNNPRHHYN